jgi:hypothetical protein
MGDKGKAEPATDEAVVNAADVSGVNDDLPVQEFDDAELMGAVGEELGFAVGAKTEDDSDSDEADEADGANDDSPVQDDDEAEAEEDDEAEAEEEDDAEGSDDSEEDADDDSSIQDGEIKGLSGDAQKAVNKRIGKEVAKRKDLEEKISSIEPEFERLKAETEKGVREQVAAVLNVDPMYTAVSDAEVSEREAYWWNVKSFTEAHMHKDEGFADEKGNEWTQEELRARHAQADEMLMRHVPQAKQLVAQRAQYREAAKELYPDLYKVGSEESKVRENAYKYIPGLAQHPDADLMIGDMIAGQRLRMENATKAKADAKGAKDVSPLQKRPKKPAKVPVKPTPAKKSPVMKKVVKKSSDDDLMSATMAHLDI